MASQPEYLFRDNTKITPDEITIAGSVSRQQHKVSECVIAKIGAKFVNANGNESWKNFQETFQKFGTESKVEAGLKNHDFILERIIPDSSRKPRKPILEFRVRDQKGLYSLAEGINNKSLAKLILVYMKPNGDDRRCTDALTLTFDKRQYDDIEEKLNEIKRNSDGNYAIYINSRRVEDGTQKEEGKENLWKGKNIPGPHENGQRHVLGVLENSM